MDKKQYRAIALETIEGIRRKRQDAFRNCPTGKRLRSLPFDELERLGIFKNKTSIEKAINECLEKRSNLSARLRQYLIALHWTVITKMNKKDE